jgi:hypothetical protein
MAFRFGPSTSWGFIARRSIFSIRDMGGGPPGSTVALAASKTKENTAVKSTKVTPGKLLTYEAVLTELGEDLIPVRSGMEALEYLLKKEGHCPGAHGR